MRTQGVAYNALSTGTRRTRRSARAIHAAIRLAHRARNERANARSTIMAGGAKHAPRGSIRLTPMKVRFAACARLVQRENTGVDAALYR